MNANAAASNNLPGKVRTPIAAKGKVAIVDGSLQLAHAVGNRGDLAPFN
jgi:hypothetical protein